MSFCQKSISLPFTECREEQADTWGGFSKGVNDPKQAQRHATKCE